MAGRPKYKMPIADRAKQFMPFAALKGLPEALAAKEHIAVPRAELSEEMASELDRKLHAIHPGQIITAVFFYRDGYRQITGMVARIDTSNRFLQIVDCKIPFDNLSDLLLPTPYNYDR